MQNKKNVSSEINDLKQRLEFSENCTNIYREAYEDLKNLYKGHTAHLDTTNYLLEAYRMENDYLKNEIKNLTHFNVFTQKN